jgi:hypothetical protein
VAGGQSRLESLAVSCLRQLGLDRLEALCGLEKQQRRIRATTTMASQLSVQQLHLSTGQLVKWSCLRHCEQS